MRIGGQMYVRKSSKDQWTSGTVLKLGPKSLYRVDNSEEPLSQLCPKSEIKPLTIQLSEAFKEGTPVMYYDHERERWMHGSLLEQVVAIAKVRLYTQRARGEVDLWFEEENTSEKYPVSQVGMSSSEDIRTLVEVENKGGIKFNALYQEQDSEEPEEEEKVPVRKQKIMNRSMTSAGIASTKRPSEIRTLHPSASWSHYNQNDSAAPVMQGHPFLSTAHFTLPPESSAPNAYQLNSNRSRGNKGRPGGKGIPAHPKSKFFRDPLASTTSRKQPTGHTLYTQARPPNAASNPNAWQAMMKQMLDSGSMMANPMMMNQLLMNQLMMNQMMMTNPLMMNQMMANQMMMNPMMTNPMMASMAMNPALNHYPSSARVHPSAHFHSKTAARGWGQPPPPRSPQAEQPPAQKQQKSRTLNQPIYDDTNFGLTHVPSTSGLTSQSNVGHFAGKKHASSVGESTEGSETETVETKHSQRPASVLSGRRAHKRPTSAGKRLRHFSSKKEEEEDEDIDSESLAADSGLPRGVPPTVESCSNENLVVNVGQPVQMSCMASGEPPPTITWRHNGQLLGTDDSHFYIPSPGFLYISSAVESDSGFYTCSVINNHGSVSRCFYLNVTGAGEASSTPNTLTLDALTDFTDNLLASVGSVSSFTEKVTVEEFAQLSPEVHSKFGSKQQSKPGGGGGKKTKSPPPQSNLLSASLSSPQVGKLSDDDTSGVGTMPSSSGDSSSLDRGTAKPVLHKRDSLTTYLYGGTDYGSGSVPNLVIAEEEDSEELHHVKSAPKGSFPHQLTPVKEVEDSNPAQTPPPAIVVTTERGEEQLVVEEVLTNGLGSEPELEVGDSEEQGVGLSKEQEAAKPAVDKPKKSSAVLSKLFKKLSPRRSASSPQPTLVPASDFGYDEATDL